ncbi:MAG: glycosyltransferase family 4 protein [Actinobacteria bacterium]|nr:MAG: glycosyltransferase family 4 protein [Actinomycetota bacterium]
MRTDLAWARAARRAAANELGHRRGAVRTVIYSSTTAALWWPRSGTIRFDATSAANRPGRHGLWQRPLERRRLAQAPLLLPWSEAAIAETPALACRGDRVLVLPVPIEPSAGRAESSGRSETGQRGRDIAAITYAANPAKKGLDRVLGAWRQLRDAGHVRADEQLLVAGACAQELQRAGVRTAPAPGVRVLGRLGRDEYRGLLRRARLFVCAPSREDYGLAQLEALADGCQLVSAPSPGPYVALAIARRLDPRLVDEDLARALRAALRDPLPGYAAEARRALAPFARAAVDQIVGEQLLPRLLA